MIFKNKISRIALRQILPIGILLAGVSSCSVSKSIAGETDGIYFDPTTDQTPVYTSTYEDDYSPSGDESLVRIGGKYFDENGNAPIVREQNHYDTRRNPRKSNYSTWGDESDNLNVSFNYFGSPLYSGFGWGVSYGWGSPYYRYRYSPYYSPYFGSSLYWGWGSPYYGYSPYYNVWDPFYDPYYYNPYYYNPYRRGYYGYGYGGYNPYYGNYYPGYYRNVRPIERGKGMNSNVTISRGNNANYRAEDSGKVRIRRYNDRTINRGNSYSAERPRTQRRAETDYNRSSRIRYNRSSSSDSWSSSRSSSWGNSNSRSYTPSSSNRSSGSRGTVRFK